MEYWSTGVLGRGSGERKLVRDPTLLIQRSNTPTLQHSNSSQGFTLLELLLAVTLLAAITGVTFMTFSTVAMAWQKGTRLMEDLHHGDFVAEQLVMGLRSAYFPDVRGGDFLYGFRLEDGGDGLAGGDLVSWVKLGGALVGEEWPFADTPHRVIFEITEDEDGESMAAVRAWQLHGQPDDFDSGDVESIPLSRKVMGFDCRCAYRMVDEEIEWLDDWEYSNRVPPIVEITLYLEPLVEGGEPQAIRRAMGIPVGGLSWQ